MPNHLVASILVFFVTALLSLFSQSQQKPDESRFTPVVLIPGGELDEPLNFEVLDDGRVYIAERKGGLRLYDPESKTTKLVAMIPTNYTYAPTSGRDEEGLVGFTIDPDFERNHFSYFLYANPLQWDSTHVLTRMELRGDTLLRYTEKLLLKFPVQRRTCCHTGGGMTWDRAGNLYITVGNNTGNSQGSQTDERPGREPWDDQRGAANTNDFRGKILRIHPEPDGSYTIPAGNLFPPGTPNTRPEIYTMGHRNAWRPSIDSRTGYLYWGEVGPDAAAAAAHTVEGHDELNQARGPGFFGWPYFVGPNRPYPISDYTTTPPTVGPTKDPSRPINSSRNNTGLRELPPAQPAFISYPYAATERFPDVGTGSRCAVGGPIYHRSDFSDPARPWPAYYEGKWIATDCSRRWIMAITMDQASNYVSMERFLPGYVPIQPLDLKFGPEGDLYVLEYGSTGFAKSADSKLVRIEYNAGNRAPQVELTSNARGGRVPFSLTLSSAGTRDPDGDVLRYQWRVAPVTGGAARTFDSANPTLSLAQPGAYDVTLTVSDPAGASTSRTMRVVAGNEPPAIAVNVSGNRTFFFPEREIGYAVQASDREDGTADPERIALSIDYVAQGFDVATLAQGDRPVDATTRFAVGHALMSGSDCRACHQPAVRAVGPSFREIAAKYRGDEAALPRLVAKVRGGGAGVWGETAMPAHPSLSVSDAMAMVRAILSSEATGASGLPLTGRYTADIPEGDNGRGSILVRAVYTDRGAQGAPAQTTEAVTVLRSPVVGPATAEVKSGLAPSTGNAGQSVTPRANAYVGFRGIDLTGIQRLDLATQVVARSGHVGGTVEVRLGSPTGTLVGEATFARPAPPQPGGGGGGGGGNQPVAPTQLQLQPTAGTHDLYLVFRNPQARPVDSLFTLQTVTFVPR